MRLRLDWACDTKRCPASPRIIYSRRHFLDAHEVVGRARNLLQNQNPKTQAWMSFGLQSESELVFIRCIKLFSVCSYAVFGLLLFAAIW